MSGYIPFSLAPDFSPVPVMSPNDPNRLTTADAYTSNMSALRNWVAAQRADASARGLWSDQTGLPTQAGLLDAARQYGQGIIAGTSAPGRGSITAYHGSPHDFNAFDMSKIGSGEGTQAYGHGMYFAGNEGVARGYKDALTADGHMYEVNINANPDHFLDWNKPLSQQSQHVQDTFRNMGYDAGSNDPTGAQLHASFGNPASTSQFLQQAGIPGVRYLDTESRAVGEGSHNYVAFDPSIVDIVRQYGIAGLIGAGGAGAAAGNANAMPFSMSGAR